MTFTKTIARKYAEAARRQALVLENPGMQNFHESIFDETDRELERERRECVAIWNAFCAEETARIERTGDANAYIKPRTYAAILPGVFVETV